MNNKATLVNSFFFVMSLLSAVILFIVVSYAMVTIGGVLSSLNPWNTQLTGFVNFMNNSPVMFDWAFLFVALAFSGGSMIWYFSQSVELVTYVISWMSVIVFIFASIIFASSLGGVIEQFPTIANQMIFIPFFANNVHWFCAIYFFGAMIGLHLPK